MVIQRIARCWLFQMASRRVTRSSEARRVQLICDKCDISTPTYPRLICDLQVTRPSEPWEFSDGAVYLVRELCVANPDMGVLFFEEIADIARLTHFVQADCLRETIWKQVSLNDTRGVARWVWPHVLVPGFARTLVPTTVQVCDVIFGTLIMSLLSGLSVDSWGIHGA